MRFVLALMVAAALFADSYAYGRASAPVSGTVTVAKSSAASATLIWDATPRIIDLTAKTITAADGNKAIEADGVRLMQARATSLKADEITVRVVYILSRQAASYGDPTLADRGPLMQLTAKRSDVLSSGSKWLEQIAKGQKVSGLSVAILGDFPTSY